MIYKYYSTLLHHFLIGAFPVVFLVTALTDAAVEKKAFDYVVGVNGDYKAAVAAATGAASSGKRFYMFFPNGEYNVGKLTGDANQMSTFTVSNVSFIGENADSTVIFNQSINEGISITSTLYFNKANNLYLQDLSILNKANYRNSSDLSQTGRHVAVKEQGDKLIYKNVKLLSTQDTYYTNGTRTYWEDGEIHGTVDFICGSGDVFFNNCLLYLERDKSIITAPATKSSWGYVFMNCTIDGTGSNHLLGRSWSNTPRCVYINTIMKKLPTAAAWGDPMNVVPTLFAEYNSKTSAGAAVDLGSRRKSYTKDATTVSINPVLTVSQAAQYSVPNVLKGTDNWQPDNLAKQVSAPVIRLEGKTLKWNDNDSVLCWVIFKNKKFVKCVTTSSFEITPDATAKYHIRAANSMGGLSKASNIVEGAVTSTLLSSEFMNGEQIMFFNKARKVLYFQGSFIGKCKFAICSLDGKVVLTGGPFMSSESHSIEIPINGLTQGVYAFKFQSDTMEKTGRINIQQ